MMNKTEFTIEKIENGYLLKWIDGIADQFSHVRFYKTIKELVGAIELILDIRIPT